MGDAPAATVPKPCCVCDAPNAKHCTKCKSRHYCGKACQLVHWKRGHNKACKQLAADFQDRLLDELMLAKLKIKEEPPIVEGVAPAAGSRAAARLSAMRAETTLVKASAQIDDAPYWRGTCAICLDLLPLESTRQTFLNCCCRNLCLECSNKCLQYKDLCPLCRTPAPKSPSELLSRLQKHADKGNVEAQVHLGDAYSSGSHGLKNNLKRAFQLYELAAAQGDAKAQARLGVCYHTGQGVTIDYKTAAQWYRRGAEQGYAQAQASLGAAFYEGKCVAQSYYEAVRWSRLAAAQGHQDALYNLGACYANGQGVPQTAMRRCASSSAPRPRGTPSRRRRSRVSRRAPVDGHDRRPSTSACATVRIGRRRIRALPEVCP